MKNYMTDEKLKLNYLFSLSRESSLGISEKMKSSFAHLGITLANWCNLRVPNAYTKSSVSCQYCCVKRTAENTSYKLMPQVRPGAAMRRIISKAQRNKQLSTIEKKLLLRVHKGNTMVVTCLVCHKKTKMLCAKPNKLVANQTVQMEQSTPKKKKKKKKIVQARTLIESSAPVSTSNCAVGEEDNHIDCEIINVSPAPKNLCEMPRKKQPRCTVTKGIVTLQNKPSHPRVKPPRQENILVNPFAAKKSATAPSSQKKKKRLSALQQMIENEQKFNQANSPRLKDFLTVL